MDKKARIAFNAKYHGIHLFDDKPFDRLRERLRSLGDAVDVELAKAINKGGREVVNLSRQEWYESYLTKRNYIDKYLNLVSAARPGNLEAVVSARSRSSRANNFRYHTVPGRRGVFLNIIRNSHGDILSHAFVIPRARSDGKPLIVERLKAYQRGEPRNFKSPTTGRFNRAKNPRFKAVYSTSVNQFFYNERDRVAPRAMSAARKQFMEAFGLHGSD